MPVDDPELPPPPWRKTRRTGPARQPLSLETIVETALRVVQVDGLDGVSMRRVAQELGTGPASLYAHVANKDELLELMLERVAEEITVPAPDPERWQEQVKQVAREWRRVLTGYGDLVIVSLANIPTGASQLRITEGLLSILRAGGVPAQPAAWFIDRMAIYVDGDTYEGSIWARKTAKGTDGDAYFSQIRAYFETLPPARFPVLTSMLDEMMSAGDEERFEFGLDLLIRGLDSYVTAPPG